MTSLRRTTWRDWDSSPHSLAGAAAPAETRLTETRRGGADGGWRPDLVCPGDAGCVWRGRRRRRGCRGSSRRPASSSGSTAVETAFVPTTRPGLRLTRARATPSGTRPQRPSSTGGCDRTLAKGTRAIPAPTRARLMASFRRHARGIPERTTGQQRPRRHLVSHRRASAGRHYRGARYPRCRGLSTTTSRRFVSGWPRRASTWTTS